MTQPKLLSKAFAVVFVLSIMLFSSSKIVLRAASLPEILVFAFLALFFLQFAPQRLKIKTSWYYGLLAVFSLIMIAGLIRAFFDGRYSVENFKYLLRLFEYSAIFFLTIQLLDDKPAVVLAGRAFLFMGILAGADAFLQKALGPSLSAALQPWGPEWAGQYTAWTFRVYSFFDNPIYLGIFAVMWLGFLATLYFHGTRKMIGSAFLLLQLPLALATVILTGSRAALAGAISVIAAIVVIRLSLKKTLALSLVAVFLIFYWANISSLTRGFYGHHETNITQRYLAYRSALSMIKDNLFLGIGVGNYRETYEQSYRLPAANPDPVTFTAENNFLETTAQMGIFGLLVYLLFYLLGFRNLYYVYRNSRENDLRALSLGIAVALGGLLVASLFATVNTVPLNMIIWLFFGLAESLRTMARREQEVAPPMSNQ